MNYPNRAKEHWKDICVNIKKQQETNKTIFVEAVVLLLVLRRRQHHVTSGIHALVLLEFM